MWLDAKFLANVAIDNAIGELVVVNIARYDTYVPLDVHIFILITSCGRLLAKHGYHSRCANKSSSIIPYNTVMMMNFWPIW